MATTTTTAAHYDTVKGIDWYEVPEEHGIRQFYADSEWGKHGAVLLSVVSLGEDGWLWSITLHGGKGREHTGSCIYPSPRKAFVQAANCMRSLNP